MNIKARFNALYKLAATVSEQELIYSSSATFVEGRLTDPEVKKAFRTLNDKLKIQLDNLRKQCK